MVTHVTTKYLRFLHITISIVVTMVIMTNMVTTVTLDSLGYCASVHGQICLWPDSSFFADGDLVDWDWKYNIDYYDYYDFFSSDIRVSF